MGLRDADGWTAMLVACKSEGDSSRGVIKGDADQFVGDSAANRASNPAKAARGLGRIVALHYRPSTSYQIR